MASKSTEKLESLLQCPICQVKLKQPKAFQCLHFYCEPCIDGMKPKTEGTVTGYECPVCKQITPKDKLRHMHFIHDMLEVVDLAKKERKTCDRCKKEVPTHRCVDCKEYFCPKCKENHDTYSFLQHHKWVEIADNSQPVVDKHVYCPQHTSELAKINCKDCNELICLICNGTKHKNHHAESIEEALDRLIPAIKEQKAIVQTKIQDNDALLANLKTRSDELKKGYKEMEEQINKKCEEVISKAREDKKQSIQELLDIKDEQMNNIQESIRKVEITLKSQHNIVALSDTTLSTAQGTSLLQTIQSDVKGSLDSFIEESPSVDPNSFELRAEFQPATSPDTLIGTISCLRTPSQSDSKFIARPLSEIATITPQLTKDVNLGYRCFRFSIIDEELWCVQYTSSLINIYDLVGTKIRTISFNQIGDCQAVAQVKPGLVVATTTGLYHTDIEGKQSNCLISGNMCDVSVVSDTVYALNSNESKVHILQFHKQNNSLIVQKEFSVQSLSNHGLDSVIVTSEFVYVGEFHGHTIGQYTTDGSFKQKLGSYGTGSGMLSYPMVCGADANGCVLIADYNNSRLQTLHNATWQIMKMTGLSYPVYAAFYKDTLYVTEELTQKLKIFSFK